MIKKLKKKLIISLSFLFALGNVSVIQAHADENDFLTDLADDGYAELGRYKVEEIKDNVYHWDEETEALPGGAYDEDGNMNNPSSMYFITDDTGVILVDLGNGSSDEEDIQNAKTIVESIVGDKPLTIIITHSHSDHTGYGNSTIFENVNVEKVIVSAPDYDDAYDAISQFDGIIETVNDEDTLEIYGHSYDFDIVNCHTEGSLMITDVDHQALFTGDTFGSGFIWAFWGTNDGNPIAALEAGVAEAREIMNAYPSLTILCGHRWQQFWSENEQAPGEMTIQYFNDMAQVISGLLDGTTVSEEYTGASWATNAVELSSSGCKAKIDTLQEYVDVYVANANQMDEAYVYSASDQLSIYSENATNAPVFVVYPDGYMTDDEALAYITDSGLKDIADRSASTIYIARPSNGESFTADDVEGFETIVNTISVSTNFNLIGIGNGATFINQNLTSYMNFVAGLALINPEEGAAVNVSVPTYLVTDNESIINTYVTANSAEMTSEGYYENPESHYEIVVVNSDTSISAVNATIEAWENVLEKFGRIGNYSDLNETATWYSRPFLTGDDEYDQSRQYQYFDSIDAIDNIDRYVITQDLDGDGIDSLWYEYIPEEVADAEDGTVPVVILFHGNTNDPRTQYDSSGWAQIASEEGIILICPEWQGHTYQGYTYDPMTDDTNATADSDVITMLKIIEEKYPQIDTSRIYVSGLSAGCRNSINIGLSNTQYFAAVSGHSGPFGATDTNKEYVDANKDTYDMPIILFTGDLDEYCGSAFDTAESNAGSQVVQLYQELNDMEVTLDEDLSEEYAYLYGIEWTTTYTIESDAENIPTIVGGIIENDNGVEICMNRIYGWGHWNYAADAQYMWEFMSKYARDTETGESIRLDLVDTGDSEATVDKSELQELVDTISAITNSDGTYTEESYNNLLAALEAANEALANEAATQEEVDAAAQELIDAYNSLVLASADTPDDTTTTEGSVPKVGVYGASPVYAGGMAVAALAGAYLLVSKKRKK